MKKGAKIALALLRFIYPSVKNMKNTKKKWIKNYLENKKNKNSKKTETVLADGSTTIGLNSTDV